MPHVGDIETVAVRLDLKQSHTQKKATRAPDSHGRAQLFKESLSQKANIWARKDLSW